MPTLVTALILVSLVRLSALGYKPLELALFIGLGMGVVLWSGLSVLHWGLNIAGMYAATAAWLAGLEATDHLGAQPLHWLLMVTGFCLIIGARLYLDLIVYGVGW